ncbi:MAG: molybdenum cofactor guanylyltransferase [Solirubrobacteraceae bacterium]|nr:molybdenum cofactor guanylyltransferase [Solirubrobacteraceae bacterium]
MSPAAIVAVLAGGASRRMGAPKPGAPLGGRPLIAWPLAAAAAAGLRAVVVAKGSTPLPPLDVEVWLEPERPQHPLTGLVCALQRAGGPIVAVACDQPWVPPELLARLAAAEGCAAVSAGGTPEPFPARYPLAALPALRRGLEAQAPLRRILATLAPVAIDAEDARLLASLNTPEALAAAERSLASPP